MTKSVIAIVGPTAIGKSELALNLARALNGEIINADSRQVYRFMDIGTAKPTLSERAVVPHHLYDVVNPDEDFSLALYCELAGRSIKDIHARHKIPILVGGSGQYVWAILEGWNVPEVAPDPDFRQELEIQAENEGAERLYQMLEDVDPQAARQIDPRNIRRVIRALEVYHITGQRFSDLRVKKTPDFNTIIIGLTTDRAELYRRIDMRVIRMIEQGFVGEVRSLIETGYSLDLPSMSSLGYREVGRFIRGEIKLAEAIERTKMETHRFARQQYTWFRLDDKRICWFQADRNVADRAIAFTEGVLRESSGSLESS